MKQYLIFCLASIICFSSCQEKQKEGVAILNLDVEKTVIKNGVLFYNNVSFTGETINYDAINKTKNNVVYVNGKKDGIAKKWFLNGSLAEVRHYKNGLKVGMHQSWWENGNKKFVYYFNDNGAYEGNVRDWYTNGQLFKNFNYKNGKESGIQQMWQSTGKIRANYNVVHGDRYGLIGLKKCATVTILE